MLLTLRKIQIEVGNAGGALAAARYLLAPDEAPRAYDREDEARIDRANSMWIGSEEALAKYNLTRGAAVDEEALASVMQGQRLDTGEQVREPGSVPRLVKGEVVLGKDGKAVRKPVVNSYDLTFSAPKSVSMVWALAGNERKAEIEQAMVEAANAAVEHVVKTRPLIEGIEPAKGFVASLSVHATARRAEGDLVPMPQLHVHVNLLGVLDAAGRMRAPHNPSLYKHSAMLEGGAVGRARLADALRRIGFGIEALTGRRGRFFEIAGANKGLCEKMSSRSREVRAWAEQRAAELGRHLSNRERAMGAALTRLDKGDDISPSFAREIWESLGQDFFVGRDEVEALTGGPRPELDVAALQAQMRQTVLRRIKEEGPTVSAGEARSIAFETAPIGLTLEQAGRVLEDLQREGELIALDEWRVTTREVRRAERYVREVALRAAEYRGPSVGARAVERGIATAERSGDFKLDPEQADAVRQLCEDSGWACLTGRAGTGKGPVLEAFAAAHRSEGWQVIATAVDGATAGRLAAQIGGEALTLDQLFRRLEKEKITCDDRTLIVIEEASKVGLDHWEKIAKLHEAYKVRVRTVGDIQQIGAIECPGMLDVMLGLRNRIPVAELLKVRRHKDPVTGDRHPWLEDVLNDLYEGRSAKAIQRLRDESALEMKDTREDALKALVERWEHQLREHRIEAMDAILVVDGSNEEVDEVNRMAQKRRRDVGQIRGKGVMAVDRDYRLYEGDVVMLRESAYRIPRAERIAGLKRIENGTLGVVSAVDPVADRVAVTFDLPGRGKQQVWIDVGRLRAQAAALGAKPGLAAGGQDRVASLRLAYAGHPFPLQGGTWRYVGALLGHWSQRKEEAYVAISRAKEYFDGFTDRESCGLRGDDDDRFRRLARRLEKPSHKLASITWKEVRGAKIFRGLPKYESAPKLAATFGVTEVTPLRDYEAVLTPERFVVIRAEAEAVAAEMRLLDVGSLRAEHKAGQRAANQLDPAAALEIGNIERDLPLIEKRITEVREKARQLEAETEGLRGRSGRRSRVQLLRQADRGYRLAGREELRWKELRDRRLDLVDEGRDPDDWARDFGARYARGLAAERELLSREEMTRSQGLDGPERSGPDAGGFDMGT